MYKDCNECPFNQFTLRSGLEPCIACSTVDEGLICEGGNVTMLEYNWWVAAYDQKTSDLKDFYNIQANGTKTDDEIVLALCPVM